MALTVKLCATLWEVNIESLVTSATEGCEIVIQPIREGEQLNLMASALSVAIELERLITKQQGSSWERRRGPT